MPYIDEKTFQGLQQSSGADFVGELIDTFLEDSTRLVAELHSSLRAQDAETFRRAAHSLKSNAATFGANELAALARELEDFGRAKDLQIGDRLTALEQAYRNAADELKRRRA